VAHSFAGELWRYVRMRRKFGIALIIIAMTLLGAFVMFAQGSALAPLIYTIF
jgi:hypothetical protein